MTGHHSKSLFVAALIALALLALALGGCFGSDAGPGPDSGSFDAPFGDDATMDSPGLPGPDGSVDGGAEGSVDAPAETGADAGTDASPDATTDATVDATVDAPLDAPSEASAPGVYVDPVNGVDTNPGTQAMPFKSIGRAATVLNSMGDAGAGQTVYLADGTYNASNQTSLWGTFNAPTFVRGSAPGAAVLLGTAASEVMYFANGGGIANVTFRNTSYSFQSRGGTFTASGITLDGLPGFNGWGMSFVNSAVATLDTVSIVNLSSAGGQDIGALLYVDNTASVTWHANTTVAPPSASPGQALFARGAGRIAIDGLTLNNYPGFAAVIYDQGQLSLTNCTIMGSGPAPGICTAPGCRASIWLGGSQTGVPTGTLTLSGTTIYGSPGSAIGYSTTNNTGAVSINLTNSHLDANAFAGLWIGGNSNAALAINVTATGTTFQGNAMSGITAAPRATISITGGAISSNGSGAGALGQTPGGIVMLDSASQNSLTMRNVTVANNSGSALNVAGTASSVLDLGTASSAGGNTFSGIPVGGPSAVNLSALIAGSAVGNTWMAGLQGADSAGHYTATTTITGPASGPNVTVPSGASVLLQP